MGSDFLCIVLNFIVPKEICLRHTSAAMRKDKTHKDMTIGKDRKTDSDNNNTHFMTTSASDVHG